MPLILSGSSGLSGNVGTTTKEMMYAGAVLQVVSASTGNITSTTSTSYIDTDLVASITPLSSTSKIAVSLTVNLRSNPTNYNCMVALLRTIGGSTSYIGTGTGNTQGDWNIGNTNGRLGTFVLNYLDSPATTSAVVYKSQLKSESGSATVYFNDIGNTALQTIATITLMEIKA